METMIDVVDEITRLISKLDTLISSLEESLDRSPEGSIELKYIGGVPRPYVYNRSTGRTEYLGGEKKPVAKPLAQKKYDQRLLSIARRQRDELEKVLKKLSKGGPPTTLDEVLASMPEPLRPLISPNANTNEGYIRAWASRMPSSYHKDPPSSRIPFYTMKGEHVRSKSGILIADRLNEAGIPYHYELAYSPNQGATIVHPDFTVLNTTTLQQFFWEHLGKMDDPEYAAASKERLEFYAKYGIVQGKGLVVTFETSNSPLNTKYIDRLIELYLK